MLELAGVSAHHSNFSIWVNKICLYTHFHNYRPQSGEESMSNCLMGTDLEAAYITSVHVNWPGQVTVLHLTSERWENAKHLCVEGKWETFSEQPQWLPCSLSFTCILWPTLVHWQHISISTFHSLVDFIYKLIILQLVHEKPLNSVQ